MKIKLYVAIAILCTSLSGILNASTTGYVMGLSFSNKTLNPITVAVTTINGQNRTMTSSSNIISGATARISTSQLNINTTSITISDPQNVLTPTSFNLNQYSCVNSLKVFQQGVNMYTITTPSNAFVVTPGPNACPSNETLQINP